MKQNHIAIFDSQNELGFYLISNTVSPFCANVRTVVRRNKATLFVSFCCSNPPNPPFNVVSGSDLVGVAKRRFFNVRRSLDEIVKNAAFLMSVESFDCEQH